MVLTIYTDNAAFVGDQHSGVKAIAHDSAFKKWQYEIAVGFTRQSLKFPDRSSVKRFGALKVLGILPLCEKLVKHQFWKDTQLCSLLGGRAD